MTDQGRKYLSDVLHAIALIEDFTKDIFIYDEYEKDLKTQSAVERQLSIIGEAVHKFDNLFPEYTLQNARKIIDFRNRLIHAYNTLDASIIWNIIKMQMEPLRREVEDRIK
jgi:uncharacterized protein with HEPN domain